ncbi:restriction endonuclease subunit S [Nocardia cyriacigeorgica]|uniref:restriction endonuclease subunit S n=1 Tax=Nocardia cyriacigeorgica TaxID=135487 RepID=UPI001892EFB6|nr:restriction endonuclease subunit S [Nocardia cyriacigeorgica]MBF6427832.1 restriction endonuclease subunit S [Nocardia cyriacigeorgica]
MSEWPIVALKDAADIVSGGTPKSGVDEYWDGDVPWVTPKDLGKIDGPYISKTPRNITEVGLKNSSATLLPANSVLLSSRAPIGHVAINTIAMATNQGFKSLVPKPGVSDAGYLYHWLRANRAYLEGLGNGATFKEVSKAVVAKVEIPLPPIEEQRRIAAILDHADALRAKRREALAHLDELTKSIFVDMFGDPVANPRGYAQVPLTEIGHLYSGGTPAKTVAENWTGSLPWFSPKDLKRNDLFDSRDHISESVPDRSSLKLLPSDTVVFVVRGMILAHSFPVSVLRVPATINQDMKAILPSIDVRVDYLASCLRVQAGHVLAQVSTAAHGTKRLDAEGMSKVSIPLPPIDEQDEFVEAIGNLNRLKSESSDSLGELDALFASLQSRAFRGEL